MYKIGDSVVVHTREFKYIPYGGERGIIVDSSRTRGLLYYKVEFTPSGISWWIKPSGIRPADTTLLKALKKHL